MSYIFILYRRFSPSALAHNIMYLSTSYILRLREFCFLYIFVVVAIMGGGEENKFDKVLDVWGTENLPITPRHAVARPIVVEGVKWLTAVAVAISDANAAATTAGSHYQ